jgi:importin subunit beta-1
LVEIGKQEYEHIQNYFQHICEVTGKLAKSENETVGSQAIEFWTTLAEEELRRIDAKEEYKGYIEHSAGELLSLLLDCI